MSANVVQSNQTKTLHTSYSANGDVKNLIQVSYPIDTMSNSSVNCPTWGMVMGGLGSIAIVIIVTAAIFVVYLAPRPAFYSESCSGRSCFKGLGLKCINKICQCESSDYYYSKKCLLKQELNAQCSSSTLCENIKSLSCIDGVCQCDKNTYSNGQQCLNKSTYNGMCLTGSQCLSDTMLYCNTNYRLCFCSGDRFWDGTACFLKRFYNETCKNTSQCNDLNNSTCINGYCICRDLEYWESNLSKCVSKLHENDTCYSSIQCLPPMTCTLNSICQCSDNEYHNETSLACIAQKTYQQNCSVTFNCRVDKYLQCINGTCKCASAYPTWSIERQTCILLSTYAEHCDYPSDCDTSKSLICNDGSVNCSCPIKSKSGMCDCLRLPNNDFFWNGASCQSAITYNQSCALSSVMCKTLTEGTICSGSPSYRCVCPSLKYFNMNTSKCENQLINNQVCTLTSDCRVDLGLSCQAGRCFCDSRTQFWKGSTCTNYYTYSNVCTLTSQCKTNLICNSNGATCNCPLSLDDNFCDCPRTAGNEFYWNGTYCVPAIAYNQSCANSMSSYTCKTLTEGTICNGTTLVCTCSNIQFFNNLTGACQNRLMNGQFCIDDSMCRVDLGLTCQSSICLCNNATQFWNSFFCTNYYTYGQVCTANNQCKFSLKCNSAVGTCNCPSVLTNYRCDCYRAVGVEYYWDGSVCQSAIAYNQPCTNSSTSYMCRTLTEGTICNGSSSFSCVCPSLKFFNTILTTCVNQYLNNVVCTQNLECRQDLGLSCQSGKCLCDNTTQFWNSSSCVNYYTYSNACTSTSQCKSNLQCNSGTVCNCPSVLGVNTCDCYRTIGNEYYWDGSGCQPAVSYNSACNNASTSYMCKTLTEGTICNGSSSFKCVCPQLQFYYTGNNTCQNQLLNNQICAATSDCRVDLGLSCLSGKCLCDNTTKFWNGSTCTNFFTYADSCSFDYECKTNLKCNTASSTCNCPTALSVNKCDCYRAIGNEYFWNGSFCQSALSYNQACPNASATYVCKTLTEGTICNGSSLFKCVCPQYQFYYTGNNTCQNQLFNNQACTLSSDCRVDLGLSCQSSKCLCDSSIQFWNGSICINYFTYTDNCNHDYECKSNLKCNSGAGTCNCPTTLSANKCDCYKVAGNESYWNGSSCQSAVSYNSACSNASTSYMCKTLTEGTICNGSSSFKCVCPQLQFYYTGNNTCQNQLLNNQICAATSDCRVDLGLSCQSGKCLCDNTTKFWNGSTCINYYTYNSQTCTSTSQCAQSLVCLLSGSSCTCPSAVPISKCDCPPRASGSEYYWNGTECVPAISYGNTCALGASYQCQTLTQGTLCNTGICSCNSSSVFVSTNCVTCKNGYTLINGICYAAITGNLALTDPPDPSSSTVKAFCGEPTSKLATVTDLTLLPLLSNLSLSNNQAYWIDGYFNGFDFEASDSSIYNIASCIASPTSNCLSLKDPPGFGNLCYQDLVCTVSKNAVCEYIPY